MVRGMDGKKYRANSMEHYAAFLVTVSLPLLALGVDVSRVELMRVKLRNATTAACQAYANSLDIQKFQLNDELVFTKGYMNASNVFNQALGQSGTFGAVEERNPGLAHELTKGKRVEIIVIRCFGTGFVEAMIPFLGNIGISETASVKTKFSTTNDLR